MAYDDKDKVELACEWAFDAALTTALRHLPDDDRTIAASRHFAREIAKTVIEDDSIQRLISDGKYASAIVSASIDAELKMRRNRKD